VWLSEETVNFALYIINRLVSITEVESVYCTVRTESIQIRLILQGLINVAFIFFHIDFETPWIVPEILGDLP